MIPIRLLLVGCRDEPKAVFEKSVVMPVPRRHEVIVFEDVGNDYGRMLLAVQGVTYTFQENNTLLTTAIVFIINQDLPGAYTLYEYGGWEQKDREEIDEDVIVKE